MSQPSKIFRNKFLSISALVDGKTLKTDRLTVEMFITSDNKATFVFDDDGYWTIGKDKDVDSFVVNEFNICNKILMDIFEEVVPRKNSKDEFHRIECDADLARYLITTSKQQDDYVYYDGYLYDVNRNKIHYLSVLDKVTNQYVTSKDAVAANKALSIIAEELPHKNLGTLVGCSLCFCGRNEELNGMKEAWPNSPFSDEENLDIKPMYKPGGDRRKIYGLIKHTYYKIKKTSADASAKEHEESPEDKMERLYSYICKNMPDRYISLTNQEITIIYNNHRFLVKMEANGKPSIIIDENNKITNLRSPSMVCDFINSYR